MKALRAHVSACRCTLSRCPVPNMPARSCLSGKFPVLPFSTAQQKKETGSPPTGPSTSLTGRVCLFKNINLGPPLASLGTWQKASAITASCARARAPKPPIRVNTCGWSGGAHIGVPDPLGPSSPAPRLRPERLVRRHWCSRDAPTNGDRSHGLRRHRPPLPAPQRPLARHCQPSSVDARPADLLTVHPCTRGEHGAAGTKKAGEPVKVRPPFATATDGPWPGPPGSLTMATREGTRLVVTAFTFPGG